MHAGLIWLTGLQSKLSTVSVAISIRAMKAPDLFILFRKSRNGLLAFGEP